MSIIVDLSSNNAHPIDYTAAKAAGVIAAFVKATDGTGYTNPFYATDVAGFAAVGVPVLGYHFAEFGDVAAEAAHFLSVAGARARVLDSETNTNAAWQNAFLAALNLPGNEELDYGSASTLPQTGIRSLLWPASYGKNWGFGDCWQYTDAAEVPGIGTCDASTWIGSQADFSSLFSLAPPFVPPPPVIYPGDNVQSNLLQVPIEAGKGWVPAPVPAAKIVSVVIATTDPDDSGGYSLVPLAYAVSGQTGPHSPNGAITFEGVVPDGSYGFTVWSVS